MRLTALLAALALAGCTPETVVNTVTGSAVDHGEALFSDPAASPSKLNAFACSTCHLAAPDEGDRRLLPGAPLAGAPERPTFWGGQENDLLRSINQCRFHFMSAQQPWAPGDPEAEAMYAFLTSLPPAVTDPVPFTVVKSIEDLAPGDPVVGAEVFVRACQACHGLAFNGYGRVTEQAPILAYETLLDHATYSPDEQRLVFIEKVRHGPFLGYGGTMPPFSREVLSDDELASLLAYLVLYPQ